MTPPNNRLIIIFIALKKLFNFKCLRPQLNTKLSGTTHSKRFVCQMPRITILCPYCSIAFLWMSLTDCHNMNACMSSLLPA